MTRLRSVRAWLVGAVLGCAGAAWIAVAMASTHYLEFSGRLGVAGIALTLGAVEASYLIAHDWMLRQRAPAIAAATGASLGALLVLFAVVAGLTAGSFAVIAAGVGIMGFSCAIGLYGLFRGMGKSTPGTVTGLVLVLALAYLAQVLWAAVE